MQKLYQMLKKPLYKCEKVCYTKYVVIQKGSAWAEPFYLFFFDCSAQTCGILAKSCPFCKHA